MFNDVLIEQNPHWEGKQYETGLQRNCFGKLLDFLDSGQILAITGVRRAGKSTLLKQLIMHLIEKQGLPPKQLLFLNLEHPYFSSYHHDVTNLQRIFDAYRKLMSPEDEVYCFLDEVQFFSNWPLFVKAQHETKRVRFILTGSNAAMLSSDMITMLSGRSLHLEVFPLSFREQVKRHGLNMESQLSMHRQRFELQRILEEHLEFGGFPTVAFARSQRSAFDILGAHAKTVLFQDVVPRLGIRKPEDLERLYVYLVSNVGKLFSYSSLGKLFDLSDKSVKDYICAFEESYLMFELNLFSYSLKKQQRSSKKIYAIDTGQVNAVAFKFSSNKGRLLENLIFMELKRLGLKLFYYNTKKAYEVDFVVQRDTDSALVQVCWDLSSEDTYRREIRALEQGIQELGCSRGLLISMETVGREVQIEGLCIISAYQFLSSTPEDKLASLGLSRQSYNERN